MSKKDFEDLVNSIMYRTGKTQEQISVDMGYNKGYISQILSRGKIPGKFVNALKVKYPEIEGNKGSSTKDEVIEVDRSFIIEVLLRNTLRQQAKIRAHLEGRDLKNIQDEINQDNLEVMSDVLRWFESKGKQAFVPVFSHEA